MSSDRPRKGGCVSSSEFDVFLSGAAWICAAMALVVLFRVRSRGIAAYIMSLAFLALGGVLYLAGAALLGARFAGCAARLRHDTRWAMPTFRCSISTLFGLFALLLADHYLRLP